MSDWLIQHGNLIEAGLWAAIGLAFLLSLLGPRHRPSKLLAAVAFGLFGLSDLVEHRSGAWWRPWWLLAWKVACIAVLLALLIHHRRDRTGNND